MWIRDQGTHVVLGIVGIVVGVFFGDRTPPPGAPPLPPSTSAMSSLYGSWRQTGENTYVANKTERKNRSCLRKEAV
jgi:hypothetical protein